MIRLRPWVAGSLAWAAGALTALAVGVLALSSIRTGLGDEAFQPPTPGGVAQAAPEPDATPVLGPTSTPPATMPGQARTEPAPTERTITTVAGTAVASCRGGQAYLVYWTPATGFRAEDVIRGPAPLVKVTFERPGREVKIVARCIGGVPQPMVEDEWGDHAADPESFGAFAG